MQVHFAVHEGQLHLIAKLLEYSFNFSRFLPNWRSQPGRRLYRGALADGDRQLVREWWRWALQARRPRRSRRPAPLSAHTWRSLRTWHGALLRPKGAPRFARWSAPPCRQRAAPACRLRTPASCGAWPAHSRHRRPAQQPTQAVNREMRRHESTKLELRWTTLKLRREQRTRYRQLHELRRDARDAAAADDAARALLELEDQLSVMRLGWKSSSGSSRGRMAWHGTALPPLRPSSSTHGPPRSWASRPPHTNGPPHTWAPPHMGLTCGFAGVAGA